MSKDELIQELRGCLAFEWRSAHDAICDQPSCDGANKSVCDWGYPSILEASADD